MSTHPRSWPPERLVALEAAIINGATSGQVAAQLNITRNAALAMAARKGWKWLTPPTAKTVRVPKAPRNDFNPKPLLGASKPPLPMPEVVADPRSAVEPKTLVDLKSCECRWPINAGPDYLFCAEVTSGPEKSWCAFHAARGHQPSNTSRSELARSLRRYTQ